MKRRAVLLTVGLATLGGCIGRSQPSGNSTGTPIQSPSPTEQAGTPDEATKERVIECERRYIRREVVDDDETVDGGLDPAIVETETLERGVYVSVRTVFGTTRRVEDEPNPSLDYEVRAYYLVTGEAMYRTEKEGKDPREGTELDC